MSACLAHAQSSKLRLILGPSVEASHLATAQAAAKLREPLVLRHYTRQYPRRYTVLGCPFSAFCYGAPSRGMASHALLRHNNAAGKSHIQYDPQLSRLPAKQKSNATLFAGLKHVNKNAIGAGSVVGLASAGLQRKTLLRISARLCFVADLLNRNSASSTPRPNESARPRFRPIVWQSTFL